MLRSPRTAFQHVGFCVRVCVCVQHVGFWWGLLGLWVLPSCILTCWSHKATNPIMKTLRSWPHPNWTTPRKAPPLNSSHSRLGLQHMTLKGRTQTFIHYRPEGWGASHPKSWERQLFMVETWRAEALRQEQAWCGQGAGRGPVWLLWGMWGGKW